MLRESPEQGGRDMMTAYDLNRLAEDDFQAWCAYKNRQLAVLDRMIAAKEAAASPESFREQVAVEAVASLAALRVANPRATWRLGVVATRAWLLEILSPPERVDPIGHKRAGMPDWQPPALVAPDSPAGEWQLWRYVTGIAQAVRDERLSRKFGTAEMTRGDLEEARLQCEIPHEQWERIRARATWVLA